MMKGFYGRTTTVAVVSILLSSLVIAISGQTGGRSAVAIDNDDIGGVVTGARGPEAGVWVIAETRSTPTRLIKSVVTDDQGRYVVPDLPKANYDVWVRGYGLVDSPKVKATPGKTVNLKAVAAPDKKAAARSTTRRSTGSRCCRCRRRATSPAPATRATASRRTSGARASGSATSSTPTAAPAAIRWAARRRATIPTSILGELEDSTSGVGSTHSVRAGRRRHERALHAGRPRARAGDVRGLDRSHRRGRAAGRRRPRVRRAGSATSSITMWDWADPKVYLHDEIASDKRNPTVNANGPIYGALEESGDYLPVVDPTTHTRRARSSSTVARSEDAELREHAAGRGRRRTGATKRSGTARRRSHSFAMDKQAPRLGRGAHPQDRRRRRGARRDRIIRRRSCSRSIRAARQLEHVRPEDEADHDRSTRASAGAT